MDRIAYPPAANNQGVFTTTGGNDLLHDLPAGRSAKIVKIHCYNNTGADVTLQLGTLNRNPLGAAFVALMPVFVALNTLDNEWVEAEIPAVEWVNNTTPTAAVGRVGDIYVLASAAGVVISLEVVEFGS